MTGTYGRCIWCGHNTYQLAVVEFCPCEGCHVGGRVIRRATEYVSPLRTETPRDGRESSLGGSPASRSRSRSSRAAAARN